MVYLFILDAEIDQILWMPSNKYVNQHIIRNRILQLVNKQKAIPGAKAKDQKEQDRGPSQSERISAQRLAG